MGNIQYVHVTLRVHRNQSGFIKSRLASKNVRHLLHIINGAAWM